MRERFLKKIKSLLNRNKMSLKVSNSSYTIPKETDEIEQARWRDPLLRTISAISTGMRNTG